VTFIYRAWYFIDSYVHTNIVLPSSVYVPVALIVLFIGYITILARQGKPKEVYEQEAKKPVPKKSEIIKRKPDEKVEWEDVSNEFKLALYNLGRSINKSFEESKRKKGKKERRRGKS
jgi:flagellar biosynthesis component FlhA